MNKQSHSTEPADRTAAIDLILDAAEDFAAVVDYGRIFVVTLSRSGHLDGDYRRSMSRIPFDLIALGERGQERFQEIHRATVIENTEELAS